MGITSLPAELLVQIWGYLETKDVETLSLCSKEYRDVALAELLGNVRLSEGSASLFDGGSFSAYKGIVRHVRLTGLRAAPPAEVLARTRFYIRHMHLFPNLNSMHMSFLAGRELEFGNALIVAMFTRLSKLPMYKNLRRVIIKTKYKSDRPEIDDGGEQDDAGGWTPELEDAMAGVPAEPGGSGGADEHLAPELHMRARGGGVYNASTMLFVNSASTLRRLHIIGMHGFEKWPPVWQEGVMGVMGGLPVFAALRELRIGRPSYVSPAIWEQLVEMFPSVEDLTVEAGLEEWRYETTGVQLPHGELEGAMGWLREKGCPELKEIGWLGDGRTTWHDDKISWCRWDGKAGFEWEFAWREEKVGEAVRGSSRAKEYYTVRPDAEEGIYDVLAD
ncbi:hypothetical protein H072_11463 [Dactylellina haptotyla CBS 200.50]|uniref:F-box domain-containing protein n=1 Tax=Dactylellina haptotyla (strain CBS 200.50) TaxID=1284197 RepID=S8A1U2_DACHA|nr:hypothetical protein H072_11463 [Dactylellina haptotyla CBS 200.50]